MIPVGLTFGFGLSGGIGGEAPVPVEPGAFTDGDWSVADAGTGGAIIVTISDLPSSGGSPIIDIEYQLDGGSWASLGGSTVGEYDVDGLVDDQTYAVAIRAVNVIGNGPASASKDVTPTTDTFTPSFDFSDARNSQYLSLL